MIGAGAFGAWTAHHLAAAGAHVTLVDAYGPGNSRSSSGDESRILRCGYGPDAIYSSMARRSRELWRALDARQGSGLPLWHPCGVLWLAPAGDAYTTATLATLRHGHYAVDVLDQTALRARYPHLSTDGVVLALIEPDAGVLMARRSIQTLAAELGRTGVRIRRGRALQPTTPGRVQAVRLTDGTELPGARFVFACGAWLPAVFPELLGPRITPTRQVVMYFGTVSGDERFTATHTPAWVDFTAGVYGIPDVEGRGFKVGIDTHGTRFDPDTGDRTIDGESVDAARAWLQRRFPAMADAPLVESRVCQYENTSNGDFVIDRHPGLDNVWLCGGGSGHGFKHGPAVGEFTAERVLKGDATHPRFALAAKETVQKRSVH